MKKQRFDGVKYKCSLCGEKKCGGFVKNESECVKRWICNSCFVEEFVEGKEER